MRPPTRLAVFLGAIIAFAWLPVSCGSSHGAGEFAAARSEAESLVRVGAESVIAEGVPFQIATTFTACGPPFDGLEGAEIETSVLPGVDDPLVAIESAWAGQGVTINGRHSELIMGITDSGLTVDALIVPSAWIRIRAYTTCFRADQ